MKCPKCNHTVSEGQTVCEHCGEPIVTEESEGDLGFVYSRRSSKRKKSDKYKRNLVIIVVAALVLFAVVIGVIGVRRFRNKKEPTLPAYLTSAPITSEPETTVRPTSAPKAVITETTVPPTTEPDHSAEYEEKLGAYIRKTGLYNTMSSAVDGNTELSLAVERNMIMATYRVHADVNNGEDEEYIRTRAADFEEVCAQLDRYVYDMKNESGVPTAVLQVTAFDEKSNIIFSKYID